ncbi:cobyrinate/hydrogenobyrinate a,c-diamide synthase [Desulfonatronum thiodismutans]|uniref:cobyrinate/hydrogenobyrinate a,c-diamide synthase n=1 Tax=Desulfonatronum thiodismutans TaxID=159290 RepID=UPI000689F8F0|nr:hydrogenobyrinic/cobyrinic acid a,c-diamide synthase [Desulfonatronum thiodismutans]
MTAYCDQVGQDNGSSGQVRGLVVAGTRSGCGKTLTTLGLAAAFREHGLRVQGFKVGPDFIDPTHLAAVSGRFVHNLDGWILSRDVILELFHLYAGDADVCLVEGVMGLFDGASGSEESGSTAQMAKWLGLPVVLVVDARSQGRSAAALVRGFRDFDPELRLAGVIFSQVGGPSHEALIREAMSTYLPDLPCLGFLPRRPDLVLPSRHLGLVMAADLDGSPAEKPSEDVPGGMSDGMVGAENQDREHPVFWDSQRREGLAAWAEQGLDLEWIQRISKRPVFTNPASAGQATDSALPPGSLPGAASGVTIGVARDPAFCFYYQENLRLLERAGARLVFFSPLADKRLPEDVAGLYLGGGYPELSSAVLAANRPMREAIRKAAQDGMPVYAECGGMMYLLSELEDVDGKRFPMVGLFPGRARMFSRFQALGYRKVELLAEGVLGPAGTMLRGHEFHYSGLEEISENAYDPAFRVEDRRGRASLAGFRRGNVVASYVHLHFGSHPPAAGAFTRACERYAANRNQRI